MASDRQGYTPYGYGMDVPVLVRSTVSYGRGWQLLRSRGAGSNATGPCDPPQRVASCNCSLPWVDAPPPDDGGVLPRCIASPACGGAGVPSPGAAPASGKLAIVFVLDGNKSTVRFYFGGKVAGAYASQLKLLVRAVLSLKAVQTTLPIKLLASGERFQQAEARLEALGVGILRSDDVPSPIVPTWASPWAKASFAKLRVLSLTQFERVVLLYNDIIALRNIDHLAAFPAPAFVYGYKCHPRRELRAAVALLEPSRAAWGRARRLMHQSDALVYDDNGEGSVWRQVYREAYELPAGYAALR